MIKKNIFVLNKILRSEVIFLINELLRWEITLVKTKESYYRMKNRMSFQTFDEANFEGVIALVH
jgi:hypothetical protein